MSSKGLFHLQASGPQAALCKADSRIVSVWSKDGGVARERRHSPAHPTGVSTRSPVDRQRKGGLHFHARTRGSELTHLPALASESHSWLRDRVVVPRFWWLHSPPRPPFTGELPSPMGICIVYTFASHREQRLGIAFGKVVAGSQAAHPRAPSPRQ